MTRINSPSKVASDRINLATRLREAAASVKGSPANVASSGAAVNNNAWRNLGKPASRSGR